MKIIIILLLFSFGATAQTAKKETPKIDSAAIEQAKITKFVDSLEAKTTVKLFLEWCYKNMTGEKNDELKKVMIPYYDFFIRSKYAEVNKK